MKTILILILFTLLITGCTQQVNITVNGECENNTFNYTYQADGVKCTNKITQNGFALRCNNEQIY